MTKLTEQYTTLITKLYNGDQPQLTPEEETMLEQKLGLYQWDDVKSCIQKFYIRNQKTAPNLTQIMAILETNPKIQPVLPEYEEKPIHKPLPTTNIRSITQTFDKLVNILVDAGVLADTDGTFHNTKGLIDPITDLPILNPAQWLKWKTQEAMQDRPDLFVKFSNLSFLEALAIAIQNGLVKIKVRDWEKAAKQLNPEEKTRKRPNVATNQPKQIGEIIGF